MSVDRPSAVSALERALGDTPRRRDEVLAELLELGFTERQVRRAQQTLAVVPVKIGSPTDPDQHWVWVPRTAAMWDVLGVPEGADTSTVRAAYRRLIADNHTDAGGSSDAAKLLGEAKLVLTDARLLGSYEADRRRRCRARDDRWDAEDAGECPPPSDDADDPPRDTPGHDPDTGADTPDNDEPEPDFDGWARRGPDDVRVEWDEPVSEREAASRLGRRSAGWVEAHVPDWVVGTAVGVMAVALVLGRVVVPAWVLGVGGESVGADVVTRVVTAATAPEREGVPDGPPVMVELPSAPEPVALTPTTVECWDESNTMRAPCPLEGE